MPQNSRIKGGERRSIMAISTKESAEAYMRLNHSGLGEDPNIKEFYPSLDSFEPVVELMEVETNVRKLARNEEVFLKAKAEQASTKPGRELAEKVNKIQDKTLRPIDTPERYQEEAKQFNEMAQALPHLFRKLSVYRAFIETSPIAEEMNHNRLLGYSLHGFKPGK